MIDVENLTKVFGTTRAVDDLSFSVAPGSVTGFLGPNGAGKSTTMRMILGLDNPTSGRALINGTQYHRLRNPLTKVGALLDANWVHPNRSARAHLTWLAASNKLSKGRVNEVLGLVGLADVAEKSVGKFSLGMKQRLGLAGALLGDPEVLLFDEPVNGLDPEGILWIRQFMKTLARNGRTVLVSSHLLSEMALTADHLVVIGRGRLIADQSTKDFIASTTQTSVRVRSPQLVQLTAALTGQGASLTTEPESVLVHDLPIEKVGELAAQTGAVLHELSPVLGSLEEAFMRITGEHVQFEGHGPDPESFPAVADPVTVPGLVVSAEPAQPAASEEPGQPPAPPPPAGSGRHAAPSTEGN